MTAHVLQPILPQGERGSCGGRAPRLDCPCVFGPLPANTDSVIPASCMAHPIQIVCVFTIATTLVPLFGARGCNSIARSAAKAVPAAKKASRTPLVGSPPNFSPPPAGATGIDLHQFVPNAMVRHQLYKHFAKSPDSLRDDEDIRTGDRLQQAGQYADAVSAYGRALIKVRQRFGDSSPEVVFVQSRINQVRRLWPRHGAGAVQPSMTLPRSPLLRGEQKEPSIPTGNRPPFLRTNLQGKQ